MNIGKYDIRKERKIGGQWHDFGTICEFFDTIEAAQAWIDDHSGDEDTRWTIVDSNTMEPVS